jgi:hypothetical protein
MERLIGGLDMDVVTLTSAWRMHMDGGVKVCTRRG